MTRYVALLRGVNVGGKNPVPMLALRVRLEALGLAEVATYIQSGNALFASPARAADLLPRLEAELARTFGFPVPVVLRSERQLCRIVEDAPAGFGARPAEYRYDVIFLKAPLSPAEALAAAPARPGVDSVAAGPGVLYFSRLLRKASQSRMSRITGLPIYQQMTIRNWNTTVRLLALSRGERPAPGV